MNNTRKYLLAFSFAGSKREFIESIKDYLTNFIDEEKIFYDNAHKHDINGNYVHSYLENVYTKDSELVAQFLSKDYPDRIWCQTERVWIDEIKITRLSSPLLMFFPFTKEDSHFIGTGLMGYSVIDDRTPEDIAQEILRKLYDRGFIEKITKPIDIVLNISFDKFLDEDKTAFLDVLRELTSRFSIHIVSIRRGSLIITVMLFGSEKNKLIKMLKTNSQNLSVFKPTFIVENGKVLWNKSKTYSLENKVTENFNRSKGSPYWLYRSIFSSFLPSLFLDLELNQESGLPAAINNKISGFFYYLLEANELKEGINNVDHFRINELFKLLQDYFYEWSIAYKEEQRIRLNYLRLMKNVKSEIVEAEKIYGFAISSNLKGDSENAYDIILVSLINYLSIFLEYQLILPNTAKAARKIEKNISVYGSKNQTP